MNVEYLNNKCISEEDRSIIAAIVYESFEQKFAAIVRFVKKEKRPKIIREMLSFRKMIICRHDGYLVGVALLSDLEKPVFRRNPSLFWKLGPFSYLAYFLFFCSSRRKEGLLKLEMIAVSSRARGIGAGSAMLKKVLEVGRKEHFLKVVLEVTDSNPRAKKLYEKEGYSTLKTVHTGVITAPAGFKSFDVMERSFY